LTIMCSPETGRITNLPQSELFASFPDFPTSTDDDQIAHYDETFQSIPKDESPSSFTAESSASVPPASPISDLTQEAKDPVTLPDRAQLIDLTTSESPPGSGAEEDIIPITLPPRREGQEEPESDDILILGPSESRRPLSRPHSASLPPAPHTVDEDDHDELDLIGSLSPSQSVSDRHATRSPSRKTPTPEVIAIVDSPPSEVVSMENEGNIEMDITGDERDSEPIKEVEEEVKMEIEPMSQSPVLEPHTIMEEQAEQTHPAQSPPIEDTILVDEDEQIGSEPPTPSSLSSQMTPPPTGPLVPILESTMSPRSQPLIIPAPSSPIQCLPPYAFDLESPLQPEARSPSVSPKQPRQHHFNPQYALPPLRLLPVEFNRKGKPARQQRKREKEREKNERGLEKGDGGKKEKDLKEDWVPMGLNRWGATIRANPVWKKVARAQKCLSTRDWGVSQCTNGIYGHYDKASLRLPLWNCDLSALWIELNT
jgi:chromatin modification-related protein VID21